MVLYTVKERQESRLPELKEVRDRVVAAFRQDRGGDLARKAADQLLSDLKAGKKLADLAKKEHFKVEETGLFTSAYGDFVPNLGNAAELAKAAFKLTAKEPVAPVVYDLDGGFVVAVLKARDDADMKDFDAAKRDQVRNSLLAQKRNEVVSAELKKLRDKAQIVISPTLQTELEGN